jgi:hypothetical protein
MALSQTFTLGSLRCHLLEGGWQRLDGGAMFGVVPKPLWSRKVPPDDRNRILLAMRCLLIEHPDGPVLVDTALGDKEDPKFLDIYAVENRGDPGPTQLEDALREAGFQPEEVRWVVNTHLHFDHAGGNTVKADKTDRTDKTDKTESSVASGSSSPATPMSGPGPATCPPTSSRWPGPVAGSWSMETGTSCRASAPDSRRGTFPGTRASSSRAAMKRRYFSAT